MPTDRDAFVPAVTGTVMDLGDGHSVAIHMRHDLCWAAEFRGSSGELFDASSWFRFHAGALRHCPGRRAAALATMAPITPELREEIERLHQQASAHDANLRQSAVLAPSALRRRYFSMASQIRGLFRSRGDQNHRGAPS